MLVAMETCQSFIDSLSLSFPSVIVDNKDTTLLCCEEYTAQSFTQCKCSGGIDPILCSRCLVSEGPLESPASGSPAADVKGKPEVCAIYSSGQMSRMEEEMARSCSDYGRR